MKSSLNLFLFIFSISLLTACGGGASDAGPSSSTGGISTDTVKPVITLAGSNPHIIKKGEKYSESGASATDDVDGKVNVSITGSVDNTEIGSYTLTYSASDSAGNKATKTRTVKVIESVVDNDSPVITLIGDDPIEIEQGETFTDPGATATDEIEGSIIVTVSGSVDTERLGTYTLTYTAQDSSGNLATKVRHVIVVPASVIHNVRNVNELRTALENASSNGSSDIIILAKGTYKTSTDGLGTFKFNDVEEFNLTLKAEDNLVAGDVVLDGNSEHLVLSYHNTLSTYNTEVLLKLENITIQNGNNIDTLYGGGIYTNHNLELLNCDIQDNRSAKDGAGVYVYKDLLLQNSLVDNNKTVNSYTKGGGVYVRGTSTIKGSLISNNEAYYGGGVNGGVVYLIDSTLTANRVQSYGGGVYASDDLFCDNSAISSNVSDNGASAIYSPDTLLDTCVVSDNTNSEVGYFNSYAVISTGRTLSINSVIENNKSTKGYVLNSGYSEVILINNSFINNSKGLRVEGRLINNLFDGEVELHGDSKIYNSYIDYLTLTENNFNVVKKNNVQPSEGSLNLSSNLVPGAGSVILDRGLNIDGATFKSLFSVGEKYHYNDDKSMYDRIVEMSQKDFLGENRVVNGVIDIGANEKQ